MDKLQKCITNQNDIYLYFELIKQIEPKRVLDVGMFLKRMGAVSRQALNTEIDSKVWIYGVDFMGECKAGVYERIYSEIVEVSEFVNKLHNGVDEKFDMAWMLHTGSSLDSSTEEMIWKWLVAHTAYAVVDRVGFERNIHIIGGFAYKELTLDDDRYAIVIFG